MIFSHKEKEMISIVYGGNRKIYEGLLMSVMSVAKFTNEQLCINVLTMDLSDSDPRFTPFSDQQIALLDEIVKKKNPQSKVVKVDMTELYKKYLLGGKNHGTAYTPYTLLRLMIDQTPQIGDKAIYLDIDTMSCSDIKQLYEQDVEDYDFLACKDYMGRFWIRPSYCNAGVLLMNIKHMKESQLFEKCRKLVYEKKLYFSDQTALNKYGKKKHLPFKFNEQRNIKDDTVVKHFCKGIKWVPFFKVYNIKQWQKDSVHKNLKIFMFDDIYAEVDKLKISHPECF